MVMARFASADSTTTEFASSKAHRTAASASDHLFDSEAGRDTSEDDEDNTSASASASTDSTDADTLINPQSRLRIHSAYSTNTDTTTGTDPTVLGVHPTTPRSLTQPQPPQPPPPTELSQSQSQPPSTSLLFTSSSGNLEPEPAINPKDRRHHDSMGGLVPRVATGPLDRKKMDEEAIAGTVVGVVLGVALLVCCLYPVVVRRLKKHRRGKGMHYDCEGDVDYRGEPAIILRRLSSSDSLKCADGTRGAAFGDGQKQPHDAYGSPVAGPTQIPSRQPSTPGYVDGTLDQNLTIEPAVSHDLNYYSHPHPPPNGEMYPADQNGSWQYVLKGTNEDYYSPYVPSEAFGMYPNPDANEGIPKPKRAATRGSSLRYNVKQLLRRKTNRDQSSEAHPVTDEGADETMGGKQSQHNEAMQQSFLTQQQTTESPTEYGHSQMPFSNMDRGLEGVATEGPSRSQTDPGASQSPYHESIYPPSHAFPGTVNPMDIMPASTESEMYHRTDYQLFTGSYESPPHRSHSTGHVGMMDVPIIAQPIPPQPQLVEPQQEPEPEKLAVPSRKDSIPLQQQEARKRTNSASQVEPSSSTRTVPIPISNHPPASFNPSELSTPAQGTASNTTRSTPSTHADSPSPESVNSSDYAQSASPHAMGIPSPRGGVYSCDEPGCSQVFDQPHKLKHHQRYHSKDHKCPYPACGKGFGTKTHLQRHINDRHEKKKKFHCSIQGCDYSRAGGKAFPRKDNWKRHMTKIHGMDHRRLPEPIEVDQEMT